LAATNSIVALANVKIANRFEKFRADRKTSSAGERLYYEEFDAIVARRDTRRRNFGRRLRALVSRR